MNTLTITLSNDYSFDKVTIGANISKVSLVWGKDISEPLVAIQGVEVTKDKRVEITFKFADICSLIDEALKGVGS